MDYQIFIPMKFEIIKKKNNQHIIKVVNKILKYPVVPAIKTLIYLKTKNKVWLNVRPPLLNHQ